MKTNRAARRIVRIRLSLALLAVITILAVEIGMGASMVFGLGQTSSPRTATQAESLNVGVGDLVALAR